MNRLKIRVGALTLAALASTGAWAQGFSLEGAIIDSRSSRSLGVLNERGDINSLFRAQKAMTFGILRAAGISLDQLSPELRARIERFQTTNVEAFRAFSQGLDLKDQGKFAEAKEFFRRAAELDPAFALATEQQRAMPDVNLGTSVQTRAIIVAAAGAAVDRGKASFAVDLARAVAAIAAGQTVVAVTTPPGEQSQSNGGGYTTVPPGSSAQFLPNLVVGVSYQDLSAGVPLNIAVTQEWKGGKYVATAGQLESVGEVQDDFYARRLLATAAAPGSTKLADGSLAYWGSWLSAPGASAALKVNGAEISAPQLGQVDYVMGEATRQMPSSNTATFAPSGGSLTGASGTISVNFATRDVLVQNLGFGIGALTFSGLNGETKFDARIASGNFGGNYSSGICAGCVAFNPQSSVFGGSFVGKNADGLVFSTILLTGNNGTASGVHLFTKP